MQDSEQSLLQWVSFVGTCEKDILNWLRTRGEPECESYKHSRRSLGPGTRSFAIVWCAAQSHFQICVGGCHMECFVLIKY